MTNRYRSMQAAVLCAAIALATGTALQAQTETGQITGTVFDASGAVVPNASLTATDQANNTARKAVTTSGGVYAFPNLLPGQYQISATASGFSTVQQFVTVTVGSKIGLDLHLAVGQQSQVVEVQEQVTQVNT